MKLQLAPRLGARVRRDADRLLALAAVGTYIVENRNVHPQVDDAFIAHRYALNLVEGNGLVYNVGERVEGFTSLAWVLLTALGTALGFGPILTAHVLGVLSGILALWLTFEYAKTALP